MKKFWELYQQSIIVTGTMTVVVVVGYVYMTCVQIPVPKDYYLVLTGCMGFFMGSKAGWGSGVQAARTRKTDAEVNDGR